MQIAFFLVLSLGLVSADKVTPVETDGHPTVWRIGGMSGRQRAILKWWQCRTLAFDKEKFRDANALKSVLPSLDVCDLPDGKDMSTWPPRMPTLHLYARAGSAQCVNYLLSIGADPNVCDKHKMTPLHHCLFQLGQALDGKGKWCETKLGMPWTEQEEQGYMECAATLLKAGACLQARSNFRETCSFLLSKLPKSIESDILASAGLPESSSASQKLLMGASETSDMHLNPPRKQAKPIMSGYQGKTQPRLSKNNPMQSQTNQWRN